MRGFPQSATSNPFSALKKSCRGNAADIGLGMVALAAALHFVRYREHADPRQPGRILRGRLSPQKGGWHLECRPSPVSISRSRRSKGLLEVVFSVQAAIDGHYFAQL